MSITTEQILEAVSNMSVLDISELIKAMEKKFGVSAITNVSTVVNNNSDINPITEEKTEFDVILKSIGTNKISVIKAVRSVLGLGLKEAKDLVESSPVTIKESINKQDAEIIKKSLKEAGAEIEIK